MAGRTVAVVGWAQQTNEELAAAWRSLGLDAYVFSPADALARLRPGDVAIGRLDVLPTLDGVEPGLETLEELRRRRIRLLNAPEALVRAHDKLETDKALARAGLPRPRTWWVASTATAEDLEPPVVLKPRFGSWGRDVFRCLDRRELAGTLAELRGRRWFVRDGAIAQELVSGRSYDIRLVVAGSKVVGAAERVARPGEWRTNVSLGGSLRPAVPPPEACDLAIAAAGAVRCDLVGIDLIPLESGFCVLEANGAVEFDGRYSFSGEDVYLVAAEALGLPRPPADSPHGSAVIAPMRAEAPRPRLAAGRKELS